MSYDVYFWWQADGHPDDIADAVADGDVEHLTPHPALAQLRRALSERHPHVGDLLDPAAHDTAGTSRYLVLALPIADAGIADDAIALARSLGITAYDPQQGAALADQAPPDPTPARPETRRPGDGTWTRAEIGAATGVGPRRLKRAWDLLGLPEPAPFSEALAGVLVALALSDGAEISADDAQRIRAEVAICAPHRGASPVGHLIVDDVHLDLAGYARSLAQALP